jgi:hypothetical protein
VWSEALGDTGSHGSVISHCLESDECWLAHGKANRRSNTIRTGTKREERNGEKEAGSTKKKKFKGTEQQDVRKARDHKVGEKPPKK